MMAAIGLTLSHFKNYRSAAEFAGRDRLNALQTRRLCSESDRDESKQPVSCEIIKRLTPPSVPGGS